MAWYTASIFLKSDHLTRPHISPLWEEKILMIEASSEMEAGQIAAKFGKDSECEYEVADGTPGNPPGRLQWKFQKVERVTFIESDQFTSGMEIFSRFLRDSEAVSLLTPFRDIKGA